MAATEQAVRAEVRRAKLYQRGFLDKCMMPDASSAIRAAFDGRYLDPQGYVAFVQAQKAAQNGGEFSDEIALWRATVAHAAAGRKGFLQRIFTLLHWGPLLYRPTRRDCFRLWPHALAVALSHGGRILIQLPSGEHKHSGTGTPLADRVWRWLLGDVARQERAAGTHGIQELLAGAPQVWGEPPLRKWLLEEQGIIAGGFVQHWGVNIALGGEEQVSPFARLYDASFPALGRMLAAADGRHGHVYLAYKVPAGRSHGGILIGVEGSQPGKWDVLGHFHGPSGTSAYLSMAGGIKFKSMNRGDVPKQHDCMFVDLASAATWERFAEHGRDAFDDGFIGQPPIRPPAPSARRVTLIAGPNGLY